MKLFMLCIGVLLLTGCFAPSAMLSEVPQQATTIVIINTVDSHFSCKQEFDTVTHKAIVCQQEM